MRRIRIHKDIRVNWNITIDGVSRDLTQQDITIYLVHEVSGQEQQMTFTASGDVVTFEYPGTDHTRTGIYRVTAWLNKNEDGQSVLDNSTAFELVARTEDEGGADDNNLTTETVELSGNLSTNGYYDISSLVQRVETIEQEGLITDAVAGSDTVALNNSEDTAVATIPAATSETAGAMTAAQALALSNAAQSIEDIEEQGLINHVSASAENVALLNAQESAVTTIPAATTQTAGAMTAAQAQTLANAATAQSVETLSGEVDTLSGSVTSLSQQVSSLSDEVDDVSGDVTSLSGQVSSLSTSLQTVSGNVSSLSGEVSTLSTTVGDLSAEVDTKDDAPTLVVISEAVTAHAPVINTYNRFDAEVGTLAITLPAIEAGVKSLTLCLTTGTTPAVTFTSADSKTIAYFSDFAIDAETSYEINAEFNGARWTIAYGIVE